MIAYIKKIGVVGSADGTRAIGRYNVLKRVAFYGLICEKNGYDLHDRKTRTELRPLTANLLVQ